MEINKIIEIIKKADKYQVDTIFQAALERKRELYPEWELLYCAMPKKELERLEENKRQIEKLMKELEKK